MDEIISKVAMIFFQHLWYFTDEVLGFFDDSVEQSTIARRVEYLRKEDPVTSGSRYILFIQELTDPLYGKFLLKYIKVLVKTFHFNYMVLFI